MANHIEVCSLLRFFKEEDHARTFMAGRLRMPTIETYREMEDGEVRGDPDEGLLLKHLPQHISNLTINGVRAFPKGPIAPYLDVFLGAHVCCLTAVTPDKRSELVNLQPFIVPCDKDDLGPYAVLCHPDRFNEAVERAAARLGREYWMSGVEYVPEDYSGAMGPFRKCGKYSPQQEIRLLLSRTGQEIFWFDIGDMSGFSTLVETERLTLR